MVLRSSCFIDAVGLEIWEVCDVSHANASESVLSHILKNQENWTERKVKTQWGDWKTMQPLTDFTFPSQLVFI